MEITSSILARKELPERPLVQLKIKTRLPGCLASQLIRREVKIKEYGLRRSERCLRVAEPVHTALDTFNGVCTIKEPCNSRGHGIGNRLASAGPLRVLEAFHDWRRYQGLASQESVRQVNSEACILALVGPCDA
jgi:hypothetical protein